MKKNAVIILAGGSGTRLNKEIPKQFLELRSKTIIAHTIDVFENHPLVHEILVVSNPAFLAETRIIVANGGYQKVRAVLSGGMTRQQSSYIGVFSAGKVDHLLIHDAVRPFVSDRIINSLVAGLQRDSAFVTAVPSADTIIRIDANNRVVEIPNRESLRRVQTPQAFHLDLIRKAHQLALEEGVTNSVDDSSLVLKFKLAAIHVIPGSHNNIKITYPGDLPLAEQILANQKK